MNLLLQQGVSVNLVLHSDSSACIGHCARRGNGKRMRHLEAQDLWIQQIIKSGRAKIVKINGKHNPADLFTKYLSQEEIIMHMSQLGFRLIDYLGNELGCSDKTSNNFDLDPSEKYFHGNEAEATEEEISEFFEGLLTSSSSSCCSVGSSCCCSSYVCIVRMYRCTYVHIYIYGCT